MQSQSWKIPGSKLFRCPKPPGIATNLDSIGWLVLNQDIPLNIGMLMVLDPMLSDAFIQQIQVIIEMRNQSVES